MGGAKSIIMTPSQDSIKTEAEAKAMGEMAAGMFRRISRSGFDEDLLTDPDQLEGFRIGAGVLHAAANMLRRYLENLHKLDGNGDGLSIWFEDDRATFAAEFNKLYGVADD